jgi:hypothetical protein
MTLLPILVGAQTCQTNSILATTPTNRFTINNDGTVSDTKTGLTWKKCSEDQSGVDCRIGAAATYTWKGALQQAQSVNNNGGFAGYKNWRLPNMKELRSIVEEQCFSPSINLAVFPESQSNAYWSSSPVALDSSGAWFVNFDYGSSRSSGYKSINFVRLVRDAPPPATSAYTKISNTGVTLPDTAFLGSGSNDWACTKDNKTGLTWEVKTDDGGLRDKDWRYSWYEPDSSKNGGFAGYTDTPNIKPNCSTKDNCNTYAFTNAVNTKGLCGKNDWRMPTKDELMKLVVCSDGNYQTDGSCTNLQLVAKPTINSTYFPNTLSYLYWSSPYAANSSGAWLVDFNFGASSNSYKYNGLFVRLVR